MNDTVKGAIIGAVATLLAALIAAFVAYTNKDSVSKYFENINTVEVKIGDEERSVGLNTLLGMYDDLLIKYTDTLTQLQTIGSQKRAEGYDEAKVFFEPKLAEEYNRGKSEALASVGLQSNATEKDTLAYKHGYEAGYTAESAQISLSPTITPEQASGERVYLGFDIKPYQNNGSYATTDVVSMGGNKYDHVILLKKSALFGDNNYVEIAAFNLNGKYSMLTGVVGHVDGTPNLSESVRIRCDDRVYDIDLCPTDFGKPIEIDVGYAKTLHIMYDYTASGYNDEHALQYALAQMILTP